MWRRSHIKSLIGLLPPLCYSSRGILADAGPIFLRKAILIISDEDSWRTFENIMSSKTSARYVPNAVIHLRELWFRGLDPYQTQAREWRGIWPKTSCKGGYSEDGKIYRCGNENCACNGWHPHPQSSIRAFLERCTGLRKITLGIEEDHLPKFPPLDCDRHLKRVAHIKELSHLPMLKGVTLVCQHESVDPDTSYSICENILSLMINGLIEDTWTHRRRKTAEDPWYHTHDLQRIYDPGEESFREYDRVWSPEKRLERFDTRIECVRGVESCWYRTEMIRRGLCP